MRHILSVLAVLLVATCVALAGSDSIPIAFSAVETGTTYSSATTVPLSGELIALEFDITKGASATDPTCDVYVVTTTNVGGAFFYSVFSNATIAADAAYYVKLASSSTVGTSLILTNYSRLALMGEQIRLLARASTTNCGLRLNIKLRD